MPREAREKEPFSYYHIQQNCTKDLNVFKTKKHRLMFLETLEKVKGKYNFKLYGVSIHPMGFEIIIYDNGNDISKIMKSLNISIAMQYKCDEPKCGTVFKERYKSDIITFGDLKKRLNKLGLCVYLPDNLLDNCTKEEISKEECVDCMVKAKKKLNELLEAEEITFEEMLKNKAKRNELIKDFRKTSVLNLCEIGQMFGGLSESGVSKILSR